VLRNKPNRILFSENLANSDFAHHFKSNIIPVINEEFQCPNVHINLKFATACACMVSVNAWPRLVDVTFSSAAARVAAPNWQSLPIITSNEIVGRLHRRGLFDPVSEPWRCFLW
jgi:hypothetical protein